MNKTSRATTCTRCGAAPGARCRYPSKADWDTATGRLLPGTVWTGRPTPRSHPGRAAVRTQPATTCQICARPIEAGTGVIAHHGYQRPGGGWQTASCMGARHRPYEQSCDYIPVAIKRLTAYLDGEKEALRKHVETPPDTLVVYKKGYGGRPTAEKDVYLRPVDFSPEGLRRYITRTYESQWDNVRHTLEKSIKHAQNDVEFLRARLAAWRESTAEK